LGGGAVAQHFDAGERDGRNEVDVDRRRAAADRAVDVEKAVVWRRLPLISTSV
jgi:hypothetical protein